MARKTLEVTYGEYRFLVRQAGGTDGMDAIFILAKGAIPAFVDVVRNAAGLAGLLSPGLKAKAQGILASVGGDSPGSALDVDVSALAPVLEGLQKLLASLPKEDRNQLLELLLFNGTVTAIHPETGPRPSGDKVQSQVTRALWDELFEGDPLGAWYVFGRIIWHNVGKSSPALAALFKRTGTGTASTSGT